MPDAKTGFQLTKVIGKFNATAYPNGWELQAAKEVR